MSGKKLLENKVCLVTGTSKGIGKAIAERFAEEGATVYANARLNGEIDEWAAELSSQNDTKVLPIYFDVTDYSAVKEAIIKIKKEQLRIDVLVNNAGIVSYELLGMIDNNKMKSMFEVNVYAVIQLIQFISRIMTRQKSGSIINISSIVGTNGVKGQLCYSATKGAIISITKSAAKELAQDNIRVNAIAPGMIRTKRFEEALEKGFKDRINNIGFGRLGEPNEVADLCVYLGSDYSSYITGQIIGVDGCTVL